MVLVKRISSSLVLAILVISLLLLVFEVGANSPLSIGQFNYFFLAFIALAIYFDLSKFFKVASSFWALFLFSLLFGLIPIIIQTAVAGTVHVDQLTTTIYWLIRANAQNF